jgi:hypothetical protein
MEGHGRRRGIKEVEPTTKIILHNTGAEMHPTNLPILVRGYLNAAGITAVMDAAAEDGRNPHPLPFSLAAREKGAEGGLRDGAFEHRVSLGPRFDDSQWTEGPEWAFPVAFESIDATSVLDPNFHPIWKRSLAIPNFLSQVS